jgi:hypothetical protein
MFGKFLGRTRSRANSERLMSIHAHESPSPISNPSQSVSPSQGRILTNDAHLHVRRGEERGRYEKLKKRDFILTPMFNEEFMQETGRNIEFAQMFQLLGWTSFYNTIERGCHLLTIEFLCTLTPTDDGVTFRIICQEHTLSWRRLSLGVCIRMHLRHRDNT